MHDYYEIFYTIALITQENLTFRSRKIITYLLQLIAKGSLQRCNQVRSSGSFRSLFSRSKWVSPGHAYMPDTDQNYLVIMCIENCNEKIYSLIQQLIRISRMRLWIFLSWIFSIEHIGCIHLTTVQDALTVQLEHFDY